MVKLGNNVAARLDRAGLASALERFAAADPIFAAARRDAGEPKLRKWPQGFATLLDIIVGQQVSTASANAIKARLRSALVDITAETVLAASDDLLRGCGLSRQKLAYVRDLAGHVASGRLDLRKLARLEEEAAIEALCQVKGIGRWTAEIYLLFALGRPDIFPADDLALAIGTQRLLRFDERPDARRLRVLAEAWQPWRGAAAHFLWHYYHFAARP
jgi:DNA-3-methyladenine glycosylase II